MAERNYTETIIMGIRHFSNYDGNPQYRDRKDRDLLGAGWKPLQREIDLGYLWQVASSDPGEFTHQAVDLVSDLADAVTRTHHSWWANILNVFSVTTTSSPISRTWL